MGARRRGRTAIGDGEDGISSKQLRGTGNGKGRFSSEVHETGRSERVSGERERGAGDDDAGVPGDQQRCARDDGGAGDGERGISSKVYEVEGNEGNGEGMDSDQRRDAGEAEGRQEMQRLMKELCALLRAEVESNKRQASGSSGPEGRDSQERSTRTQKRRSTKRRVAEQQRCRLGKLSGIRLEQKNEPNIRAQQLEWFGSDEGDEQSASGADGEVIARRLERVSSQIELARRGGMWTHQHTSVMDMVAGNTTDDADDRADVAQVRARFDGMILQRDAARERVVELQVQLDLALEKCNAALAQRDEAVLQLDTAQTEAATRSNKSVPRESREQRVYASRYPPGRKGRNLEGKRDDGQIRFWRLHRRGRALRW